MTIFVIERYYWNDNADCRPYWSKLSDKYFTDEPEDEVKKLVDHLNKKFVADIIEELNDELKAHEKTRDETDAKLTLLKEMDEVLAKAVGFDKEKFEKKLADAIDKIDRVKDKITKYESGNGELTKEKYVYSPLQLHGIADLSSGPKLVKKLQK